MNDTNAQSILKLFVGVLIVIAGIWLIMTLFTHTGFNMGTTVGHNYQGGHMVMGTGVGYGATGSIYLLLMLLVKVLFVLFIIGLVIGIAVAISRYLFTEKDINTIKGTFTGTRTVIIKETCVVCGKEQEGEWKICPFCGKEKEIN